MLLGLLQIGLGQAMDLLDSWAFGFLVLGDVCYVVEDSLLHFYFVLETVVLSDDFLL